MSNQHDIFDPTSRIFTKVFPRFRNIAPKLASLKYLKSESASTSRPPAGLVRCVYTQRHRQIFPPGFDNPSLKAAIDGHYYPFSPEHLYDVLTNYYNPDERVEHIVIKSASYCKQHRSPQHEFILIQVEDKAAHGLVNYIVLDRNNGDKRVRRGGGLGSGSWQHVVAKDEFRVSYDGDSVKLLKQCELESYDVLEEFKFASLTKPFFLYQLATLARTASVQRARYDVISANCYWFAGLIWECMTFMNPEARRRCQTLKKSTFKRGTFLGHFRQDTNRTELELAHAQAAAEILKFEQKLTDQKEEWIRRHEPNVRQENEETRRELEELRRKYLELSNHEMSTPRH
ncbi:hypothetical protein CTheo_7200 [Ceratobasidium theobromae]|uniref:PPPDE domain-containing protein n=1 Tax=Ceratobasidium theobromae TaxID=1582974 RepID=A0A5N5QC95_9AGAM|nr:hypothetical protein CTheo_7200 [Ceratobasidium theobromae]